MIFSDCCSSCPEYEEVNRLEEDRVCSFQGGSNIIYINLNVYHEGLLLLPGWLLFTWLLCKYRHKYSWGNICRRTDWNYWHLLHAKWWPVLKLKDSSLWVTIFRAFTTGPLRKVLCYSSNTGSLNAKYKCLFCWFKSWIQFKIHQMQQKQNWPTCFLVKSLV